MKCGIHLFTHSVIRSWAPIIARRELSAHCPCIAVLCILHNVLYVMHYKNKMHRCKTKKVTIFFIFRIILKLVGWLLCTFNWCLHACIGMYVCVQSLFAYNYRTICKYLLYACSSPGFPLTYFRYACSSNCVWQEVQSATRTWDRPIQHNPVEPERAVYPFLHNPSYFLARIV